MAWDMDSVLVSPPWIKDRGIFPSVSPSLSLISSSPSLGTVMTICFNSGKGRKASRAILITLLPPIREYSFFSPSLPLLNLSLLPAAVIISAKSLDIF